MFYHFPPMGPFITIIVLSKVLYLENFVLGGAWRILCLCVAVLTHHVNFAIFVTYFLIGIQLLCMGNHIIVQKFYFPMMIFCVDDPRCSELRYGLCNKDHAGQSQFVDNEYR